MKYILTAAIAWIAITSNAQQQDFAGTWKLKEQKTISGTLYSNGVPKEMTITQTGNIITIDKVTAGDGTDIKSSETPGTEAKPFEIITPAKRKKLITITWNDKGFVEIANLYSAADNTKLELTYTDIFTIENGELILIRKAENLFNGETWQSRSNYEKQ